MIFVNFKTYQKGTGEEAVLLARICSEISQKCSVNIVPVVQSTDIFRLSSQGFLVWAQHVDNIDFGPHTGHFLPQAAMEAGAQGTLLNHSENKLQIEVVTQTIKQCQDLNLSVLVCSNNLSEAQQINQVSPDFIAYEPPELIGSKTLSVSTGRPDVVSGFVAAFPGVPVMVGAGIHGSEDVRLALKLGAKGILVSSDVLLSLDPEKALLDLALGFT